MTTKTTLYFNYLLSRSSSNIFQDQSDTETSGTIGVNELFGAGSSTKKEIREENSQTSYPAISI